MLYRVFRATPGADVRARGGPLFVPRDRQGAGRHDDPGRYGAFYAARSAEGAVAEAIQQFRGRDLADADFALADGSMLRLATIDDTALGPLADLDDPAVLLEDGWRPSRVASRERLITQPMAGAIHASGAFGLSWWSTLDSAWTNVTLFAERALPHLELDGQPDRLSILHPAVIAAADRLVIALTRRRRAG